MAEATPHYDTEKALVATTNQSPLKFAFLMPPVLYYGMFFIAPLAFLIVLGFWIVVDYQIVAEFSVANYVDIFKQFLTRSKFGWTLLQSLYVAVTTTAISVVVCYLFAMAIVFAVPERFQRWFLILAILPFWSSYILRLFSWQLILAREGVLNVALAHLGLGEPLSITNTQIGTRVGLVHYLAPVLIIVFYVTLINVDRRLIEAGRDLGATRLQALVRIVLPLSKFGVIFATAFALVISFGDILSGVMVGGGTGASLLGRLPLYSAMIMSDYNSYTNLPHTAALATILVVIMVFILIVAFQYADRARREVA